MKYLKTIYEKTDRNVQVSMDFEHLEDDQLEKIEDSETKEDFIKNIISFSKNYETILLNADISDTIRLESLFEYISVIQLIFLKNNIDYIKIISNSNYFDKKPFNIYKESGGIIWKNFSNLNFENESLKMEDAKSLKYNLTKDVQSDKDIKKIEDLLKDIVDRKSLRRFLRTNRKSNINDVYDTLAVLYFIKNIEKKHIDFLNNEDIKKYYLKEDNLKNKNKNKNKNISNTVDSYIDKAKNYALNTIGYRVGVPTVGLGVAAATTLTTKQKNHINQLNDEVKDKFVDFIKKIQQKGYKVIITSSYRDFNNQDNLKKQNSSNSSAGYSAHNYGLALDINLIGPDGVWYKKSTSLDKWLKTGIPQLAKTLGFRWGGDFKKYHDPVHFDVIDNDKYNTKTLLAKGIQQYGDIKNIQGNKIKIS